MKKVRVLALLGVFLISFAVAQEISVDLPSEISVNEEFEITISLIDFQEDSYDVKIDILDEGTRIARIYNGENWASTYYYLGDSISPSSPETFILKIVENFNSAEIIIKIRSSGGNSITFEGYSISNDGGVSSLEEENSSEKNTENTTEASEEYEESEEAKAKEDSQIKNNTSSIKEYSEKTEKITLNANSIENQENPKSLNKEINSAYYLISFCLLLGLLILLRAKKKPKNEFR